ncbi:GNAT family N-acetyltransferase [Mariniblastus sp.]|nr:GNAT family N-acetyltransferase [Mariniblastus sp.]
MSSEVKLVDYHNPLQAAELVELMNSYATDEMGGYKALPEQVKQDLVNRMSERSYIYSAIAYVDGQPAGLINYLEGFSTFKAKPLLNVHDVVVKPEFRGQGLSRLLFEFVFEAAKELGCCKVTLEVLENNEVAKRAYSRFGFEPYRLSESGGVAQFWQKSISKN